MQSSGKRNSYVLLVSKDTHIYIMFISAVFHSVKIGGTYIYHQLLKGLK